ncbi:GNAT family N-acetyltransferase [Paenibacillus sp. An7]|uniref:GNAT family N-acetyltransferase n=1 Tax=Paenibacillus sp. An7 TaxID=2689577 RepID=UPI00135A1804|nr:GNAT family N-acetyltransferase [Paenibacillus sp. An7]
MLVTHEIPSIESYLNLRRAAGLSNMSREGAKKGLPSTLFAVSLMEGERLMGMGRVVGDGGLQFLVCDIAVHPDKQGQGYGKKIMKEIKCYIDKQVPAGGIVSLIADKPADLLYQQFGFADAAPGSLGMWFKQSID